MDALHSRPVFALGLKPFGFRGGAEGKRNLCKTVFDLAVYFKGTSKNFSF
jgi:hypothetical protein